MDLWKMQLRAASFRGVSFGVTADESEGGRRTVTHEFPQREAPYVEDLGGAPRRFTVQAFVLGSDYMSRRDALEAALQQPGPGTLVHPWYGEVQVSQTAPYKVRHSAQDGGMAVFQLFFCRDTEPNSPAASVNQGLAWKRGRRACWPATASTASCAWPGRLNGLSARPTASSWMP